MKNRYITKSGKIIWLAWTSIPSDEDQTIFAIAKEITHKKRLESERNNQLAQLSNRNAEFREINYRTTHDLRSPIQNMQTLLNMIDLSEIGNKNNRRLIDLLKKRRAKTLREKMNSYIECSQVVIIIVQLLN